MISNHGNCPAERWVLGSIPWSGKVLSGFPITNFETTEEESLKV